VKLGVSPLTQISGTRHRVVVNKTPPPENPAPGGTFILPVITAESAARKKALYDAFVKLDENAAAAKLSQHKPPIPPIAGMKFREQLARQILLSYDASEPQSLLTGGIQMLNNKRLLATDQQVPNLEKAYHEYINVP
jgi:hypothetical protein